PLSDPHRAQVLQAALLGRAGRWKSAADRATRLSVGKTGDAADAVAMTDDYRMLAHDVARIRRLLPRSRAREFLESTYALAHATLHRSAWHPGFALRALFRDEIPAVVHSLRAHIIWATSIFILTVAAGFCMVHAYPDLIALFASPELVATVE